MRKSKSISRACKHTIEHFIAIFTQSLKRFIDVVESAQHQGHTGLLYARVPHIFSYCLDDANQPVEGIL